MLDLMRRKQRYLKLILWVVIIVLGGGMLLLFVDPGGGRNSMGLPANQAVASVNGREISANQFRTAYYNFLDNYRRYYNIDSTNADLLKMLRVDRMALDKLIKDNIVASEARRLGLEVSPDEIRDSLRKIPGLNENGRFIGRARLEQVLRANNSSLPEFETSLISELLNMKLRNVITAGVDVSDEDVRKGYIETSQKATIQYVTFKPEDSTAEVQVVEAELRPLFDKNKEKYRIPEQRRIKYLQVDVADLRAKVAVSEQDILNAFNSEGDHLQVRARHILFKVDDPAKEAEVKSKAEAVLAEARQGKDFAELARKYSQDTNSAINGGDVGFFRREQMATEFSDAAYALEPGSISDLVKSSYGFHIIKTEEKKTLTLDDRRAQLEFQLKNDKAEELARNRADEATAILKANPDINQAASSLSLQVRESGFFRADGAIPGLGQIAGLQDEVFGMKTVGEVGTVHKAPLGFIIPQLAEKKEPFIPDISEVRAQVVEDYKKEKAERLAESKARQFASSLSEGSDMAAAAQKIKAKAVTTDPFTRRSVIDNTLNESQDILEKAFNMPIGKFSEPVKVATFYTVFKVVTREVFDESKYAGEHAAIKERLQTTRKANIFQAYLDNLDQKMRKDQKILINQDLIDRVIS
jgi:peptidyl-prolyl cis-trans isomerase D